MCNRIKAEMFFFIIILSSEFHTDGAAGIASSSLKDRTIKSTTHPQRSVDLILTGRDDFRDNSISRRLVALRVASPISS